MSALDRDAVIEQTADELNIGRVLCLRTPEDQRLVDTRLAELALPVIAQAILAPLEQLHRPCTAHPNACEVRNGRPVTYCEHCDYRDWPCPTARLIEQIRSESART